MIVTFDDDLSLEFDKRELTKEYLESVLRKVKEHLPPWLYKQIHQFAMSSAGGRTRWRKRDLPEDCVTLEGEITKVDEELLREHVRNMNDDFPTCVRYAAMAEVDFGSDAPESDLDGSW